MQFDTPVRSAFQWLRSSQGIALLVITITTWTSVSHFYPDNNYRTVVQMDGDGYYAYLPFVFETQGSTYQTFADYSYQADTIPHFLRSAGNGFVNKYFAGEAVLLTPFYLTSKLLVHPDPEHPGYSRANLMSVAIGAMFYFAIGILLFRRFLRSYGFSEPVISTLLIGLTFGTNLWWYVAREPSMSHVYSFFLVCSLLLLFQEYAAGKRGVRPILLFACAGLLALTRPTDALIALFIPLFLNRSHLILLARNWLGWLILICVVSIQPILYFIQCGEWAVWSYADEGFNFSDPYLWSTWFSWLKGLGIYFPFLLLVFPGFYFFWKKKRKVPSFWLIAGLFVVFYILSSWHAWHYGWSFGMRAYIQFYPFLLLSIGYLIEAAMGHLSTRLVLGVFIIYALLHTFSAAQIASIDYGFIQNITQEDWSQLLFRDEDEIRQTIKETKVR